jgi:hypothetical protein
LLDTTKIPGMLIVNTTYQVSLVFEEEWKKWVLTEYAPEVVASGLMVHPKLFRLLIENEPEMVSYALQFEVKDLDTLESWFERFGKDLQLSMDTRFEDKVLGFTTLMESV